MLASGGFLTSLGLIIVDSHCFALASMGYVGRCSVLSTVGDHDVKLLLCKPLHSGLHTTERQLLVSSTSKHCHCFCNAHSILVSHIVLLCPALLLLRLWPPCFVFRLCTPSSIMYPRGAACKYVPTDHFPTTSNLTSDASACKPCHACSVFLVSGLSIHKLHLLGLMIYGKQHTRQCTSTVGRVNRF